MKSTIVFLKGSIKAFLVPKSYDVVRQYWETESYIDYINESENKVSLACDQIIAIEECDDN